MFLAIINDTYSDVKELINVEPIDFDFKQFCRKHMKNMYEKLLCCRKNGMQSNDSILNDKKAVTRSDNENNVVLLDDVFKEYSVIDEEIIK